MGGEGQLPPHRPFLGPSTSCPTGVPGEALPRTARENVGEEL